MGAKQDEFYTQLRTIEDELRHYRKHFKGKTVLCNCDDPFESNFFKYFALNFNKLGLKKLIATCYAGSSIAGTQLSLFGDDADEERRTPSGAAGGATSPSTPTRPRRSSRRSRPPARSGWPAARLRPGWPATRWPRSPGTPSTAWAA